MMRRTSAHPLVGLQERMPAITAEMNQAHGFFPLGARVVLVRPDWLDKDEVPVYAQGRLKWHSAELSWDLFRSIDIRQVATEMAVHCLQLPGDEMVALVDRIRKERIGDSMDFGVDLGEEGEQWRL